MEIVALILFAVVLVFAFIGFEMNRRTKIVDKDADGEPDEPDAGP